MKYLSQTQAAKAVEKLIGQQYPGAEVELILWEAASVGVGVRVAEISLLWREADGIVGSSWMQCDPQSLLVCALAERAMLARMTCTGCRDSEQQSEIDDADAALLEYIAR